MDDFNFLKNNILNNREENKTNQKLRSQPSSSNSIPRTKQVCLRKDRTKCQVVFNALKAKYSSEWYFDSGFSRPMIRELTFFLGLQIRQLKK